jgi:Ca2+-transporting ATPase
LTEKTGAKQAASYQQPAETVLAKLRSNLRRGLSAEEARGRLEQYGPNELEERSGRGPWAILWEQFTSAMIVILIVAAVASALLGDYEDSIAIAVIVVLNAALGFGQEYRAERAMDALKRLSAPIVKVRRNGHVREVSARELVPGDVVLLEAGNLVPADGRLLEGTNLRVQESALTGESEPVEKDPVALEEEDPPLGERANMVYSSTVVTQGRGLYVVTETGMATELGKIAAMIQTAGPEQTPLQRRLDQVRGLRPWLAPRGGPGAHVPHRGEPGGGSGAGGAASGSNHRPCIGRAKDAQATSPHPQVACGGDARVGNGDLLRQDRHLDRESHDRDRA